MRRQLWFAAGVVLLAGVGLSARPDDPPKADAAKKADAPAKAERVLPGLRRDGFVQLPNQWKLKPAGQHVEVGDLPVNIALHPTGQYAAVLHAGFREHEVVVIDLNPKKTKIVSRAPVEQAFYGLTFSPDGRQVYASGGEFESVNVFDFDRGYLAKARPVDVSRERDAPPGRRVVVGGLAFDAAGRDLFVASPWGDCVVRVPLANPDNKVFVPMTPPAPKKAGPGKGEPPSPPDGRKDPNDKAPEDDEPPPPKLTGAFPYTVLPEPGGKRLFVSLWNRAAVAVIDLEANAVVGTWPTAEHPTEMVLSPKGDALYVACANSTKVSVLDPATGKGLQTIACSLYPQAPNGNTPNSLCLTPDGQMLFVANADANNLAVFNVADRATAKPLGFVPTGWYPTSVRFNPLDKKVYVANGKGLVSKANRAGPNPQLPAARNLPEYIGQLFNGTVSVLDLPTPTRMAALSKTAYECSPLRKDDAVRAEGVEADNPIPKKLGDPSPIKYVIYCVKENRTYDQVFGDMAGRPNPKGNGEPGLCLFPDGVTPNHHKIADEFVLLDNFYVDGEVSADGHEWTMGAYATDFVEKIWPLSYRGSPRGTFGYPSEGALDPIARPAGGYLWDRCAEAKVSFRTYGEWTTNVGAVKKDGTFADCKPSVPALAGKIDPQFRSYDLAYPDVKRAERFISELQRFENEGDMPRMQVFRLPNDHTAGTRVGAPTVRAMVADNDLALGMVVEALSKSKFWKETALFVIEDDTQNGPDHVDAHRSVALVVSPYTKRGYVDSTLYSTTSMLRTMELILGLKPMSQFDAAARPMYGSFTARPDLTPYTHVVPRVDLNETNKPGAPNAELSQRLPLDKEDQADDIVFSRVIWQAVKGPKSEMPPPVRAAFFVPVTAKHGGAKKDDDDDD
ncbi:MAG: beta-propeller fold lactonase family protein [Gemmataceae bacterium]|nr:beta-propeller fold lactonase family protein [Gemmataceae bacterium]